MTSFNVDLSRTVFNTDLYIRSGRTSQGHCFLHSQLALVLALGVAYCRAFALVLLPQAGRVAPLKQDIHPGIDAVVHLYRTCHTTMWYPSPTHDVSAVSSQERNLLACRFLASIASHEVLPVRARLLRDKGSGAACLHLGYMDRREVSNPNPISFGRRPIDQPYQ